MGNTVKGVTKFEVETSIALPSSTKLVTSLYKAMRLLKHGLPFINPCKLLPIIGLSFMCMEVVSLMDFFHHLPRDGGEADWPLIKNITRSLQCTLSHAFFVFVQTLVLTRRCTVNISRFLSVSLIYKS